MTDSIHQRRYVWLMGETLQVLGHLLTQVTQEQAQTLRDGEDGWTVLEVVCHLRDFNGFFFKRAQMIVEQDNPALPAYDHEAIAIEQRYNEQNLREAFVALADEREAFRDFFKNLTEEQWTRVGIHPEKGVFSLIDAAAQVGTHELDHIEQITRILAT